MSDTDGRPAYRPSSLDAVLEDVVAPAGPYRLRLMVVLTNYATPDIRRKSIECGADAVFDKSTEIDPFLELCRQYSVE